MSVTPLTKQVASLALKKLGAVAKKAKNAAHPAYVVYYNGKVEAITSLRHSSTRDIPCDHIKKDLRVDPQFVLELAHCTKYLIDWAHKRGLATAEEAEAERLQREQDRKARIGQRLELIGVAGFAGDYSKLLTVSDEEFDRWFAEAQKMKLAREGASGPLATQDDPPSGSEPTGS